jgi:pimeloyl-ACP methyl ester carboxylesterase
MVEEALARRCSLGLEVRVKTGEVVHVTRGGTAAGAGVEVGDRLVSINGKELQSDAELATIARGLSPGARVEIEVKRGGEKLRLEAAMAPAPVEHVAGASVRLGHVVVGGYRLRTIVTTPLDARPPFPLVLYLPGLGHGSCELPADARDPRRKLFEGLTSLGFATMRVERSGTGDSEGPPASEVDLFTEVDAYRAALDAVASHPDVAGVVLFGHSVGGMIAPLLAGEGSRAHGAVVFGTSSRKWTACIVRGTRRQRLLGGAALGEELDAHVADWAEMHARVCGDLLSPDEVFERYPRLAALRGPSCRGRTLFGRNVSFFQQLERLDLRALWRTVAARALVLSGQYDWICDPEEGRAMMAELPAGRFVELPAIGHDMLRHASLEQSFRAPREGVWDGSVVDAVRAWIAELR